MEVKTIKKAILSLIICLLFILPVGASNIQVSPASLTESGDITITNNGQNTLSYNVSLSQIMKDKGNTVIIDNVKADVTFDKTSFVLAPGESTKIHVNIGNTNNNQYGVRIVGMPEDKGITIGISVIVRLPGTNLVEYNSNLDVIEKYFPVALSGVPYTVNYIVNNPGTVPVKYINTTLYPGDSDNIQVTYNTDLLSWGFVTPAEEVKVFVIPTPVLLLAMLVGAILYLRRKIEIVKK